MENNFLELYEKLYNENFNELEKLRKKEKKAAKKILNAMSVLGISIIITIILFVIVMVTNFSLDLNPFTMLIGVSVTIACGFAVMIIFIISSIIFVKNSEKLSTTVKGKKFLEKEDSIVNSYKSVFKEKIIKPIIKLALPDSEYFFNKGLTEREYLLGNWERYYYYYSEDRIVTNININSRNLELVISEVWTRDIKEDSPTTVFNGLAGYINLPKDVNCYIKAITNNWIEEKEDNIQMDVSEFEKVFDIKTNDKIKTMQILTAEVMLEFLDFIDKNRFKFEFYIKNSIMYIRFHTGLMFEPEVLNESLQYEYLKNYFNVITSIKSIIEHICQVIDDTEL